MTEAPQPQGVPSAEPDAPRQSTPFLVLQFFIFPMAIVAVCVTVFVIFGLISADTHTPREYLAEARAGGGMFNIRRWQAAYALASVLESPKELASARSDPKFVDEVLDLYRSSAHGEGDDVLLRRYLTLALGRLGDPRALPELQPVALQEGGDPQTTVYAIWALGAIADPQSLPDLAALAHGADPGIRKTAVHALGAFRGPEAEKILREALIDGAEDVRWNAAVALGRRGDAAASSVLASMLDRGHLAGVAGLSPEQLEDAMLEAVKAAAATPDPSLRPLLEKLRDQDPSVKVRAAAAAALGPASRASS